MQMIPTQAGALCVRSDGPTDGRPVVLANSLGTDMRVWDALIPHLPDGLRLIRFDKRGHGLSDCPEGPYALGELVGDALAVLDHFELAEVTWVGLSIGGLIGQGIAARDPSRLRSLCLMDTAAKIGTSQMWQDRIAALQRDGMEAMVDAILERWFAKSFRADPMRLAPWRNMLLRTPLDGYVGCCHAIAGADYTDAAAGFGKPVMAMVGVEDGSTTPDIVKATADLFGAPCHAIEDAAHIPCVEKPAEVAALLAAFLKET